MTYSSPLQLPSSVKAAYEVAIQARTHSHSPYSMFKVGAALIDESGKIHGGTNVENASYGATICAERSAVVSAIASGSKRFTDVIVVTDLDQPVSPCALCLQVLVEFADENLTVWVANLKGVQSRYQFRDLLPVQFSASDLGRNKP